MRALNDKVSQCKLAPATDDSAVDDSAVDDSASAAPAGSIILPHRPLPLRGTLVIDPTCAPDVPPENVYEHGAPTRRYLNKQIVPAVLEGMKLIFFYQPAKPLKALGEYLLTGEDNISGCEKAPFPRKVVQELFMEGMKYLAFYQPEDGKKWFGEWFLKRSAELEEEEE